MTTTASLLREETSFDEQKAQAFAGKLLGALNNAALVLMSSIGHRTGLFAHLAKISPCTAVELAEAAGLAERYVREWLAVMTTSGVVDYDPPARTYALPAEHAAFLTYGGPVNIAVNTQFLGVTAAVEDEIVARFRDAEGMHYHHYGRFHEVMAEASSQSVASKLVDVILPLVPGLAERLDAGIDVVDMGCGAGRALLQLAGRFPRSRFTGLDLCAEAFKPALEAARADGLANLSLRECDVSGLDTLGACDLVLAFDAVHDQKDPQALLRMVRRSLREDGVFLMVDIGGSSDLEKNIGHPLGSFLYMMSCMHCTPVSLGQGGPGLGAMWGVELASGMLSSAGFSDVRMTRLPHDIVNAYFVARA
jgi:SAM-dependent methyltransferase